jgi:hypothetical protein
MTVLFLIQYDPVPMLENGADPIHPIYPICHLPPRDRSIQEGSDDSAEAKGHGRGLRGARASLRHAHGVRPHPHII